MWVRTYRGYRPHRCSGPPGTTSDAASTGNGTLVHRRRRCWTLPLPHEIDDPRLICFRIKLTTNKHIVHNFEYII